MSVVTHESWNGPPTAPGRDGFIANTAVQLDRLQHSLDELKRDGDLIRAKLDQLSEHVAQSDRQDAYERSLRNAGERKIEIAQHCLADLKQRFDAFSGDKSAAAGLPYRSLQAINERFAELARLEERLRAAEGHMVRHSRLFVGALLLVVLTELYGYLG